MQPLRLKSSARRRAIQPHSRQQPVIVTERMCGVRYGALPVLCWYFFFLRELASYTHGCAQKIIKQSSCSFRFGKSVDGIRVLLCELFGRGAVGYTLAEGRGALNFWVPICS